MPTTELFIPRAKASLGVVPESFDTAEVRASFIRPDDEHPTVTIELQGFTLQSFQCDPHAVAAALRNLADRINRETGYAVNRRQDFGVSA